MATGVGVFLPICWPAVVAALVIWIAVVAFWRYVSLGSMCAAAALPVALMILPSPSPNVDEDVLFFFSVLITGLIVFTHRSNIKRLLSGTENRFGKSRASTSSEVR